MQSNEKKSSYFLSENPILRRLKKNVVSDTTTTCSYKGIFAKLVFFVLMIGAGIALSLIVKASFQATAENIAFAFTIGKDSENIVYITKGEMVGVVIAGIVSVVAPLLATFIVRTIPVTGTLFCASIGYILAWAAATFGNQLLGPILLALVITLIIVFTMGFLYGMGIIKVSQKFKTFILTAMITVCLGSLLVFVGSFIPGLSTIIAQLRANAGLSIALSAIMVVVGTLFLLVDFETIRESVEGGLPKNYEWYASFGLAFSVIWLYFKVLDLILKILGSSKN